MDSTPQNAPETNLWPAPYSKSTRTTSTSPTLRSKSSTNLPAHPTPEPTPEIRIATATIIKQPSFPQIRNSIISRPQQIHTQPSQTLSTNSSPVSKKNKEIEGEEKGGNGEEKLWPAPYEMRGRDQRPRTPSEKEVVKDTVEYSPRSSPDGEELKVKVEGKKEKRGWGWLMCGCFGKR